MALDFGYAPKTVRDPIENAATVTPSDSTDLSFVTRNLYIGTGGDLRVTLLGGQTVTYLGVAAGDFPRRVKRVHTTGTTATNIIAEW